MTITLSKTETSILVAAASRPDTLIEIPSGQKPSSRGRLLGRFLRDRLVAETEDGGHQLTPAGFLAVGLRPPRKVKPAISDTTVAGQAPRPGTKVALIADLLARPNGATVAELISATGWLPHTVWAALSRVRSAGQALAKSARPDGTTAYRIEQATAPVASDTGERPGAKGPSAPALQGSRSRGGRRKVSAVEVGAAA